MDYDFKNIIERLSQEISVLQKRVELLEQKVSAPTFEMQSALSQKPHTGPLKSYKCTSCILFSDRLRYFFQHHTLMAVALFVFLGAAVIVFLFRVYGIYS